MTKQNIATRPSPKPSSRVLTTGLIGLPQEAEDGLPPASLPGPAPPVECWKPPSRTVPSAEIVVVDGSARFPIAVCAAEFVLSPKVRATAKVGFNSMSHSKLSVVSARAEKEINSITVPM